MSPAATKRKRKQVSVKSFFTAPPRPPLPLPTNDSQQQQQPAQPADNDIHNDHEQHPPSSFSIAALPSVAVSIPPYPPSLSTTTPFPHLSISPSTPTVTPSPPVTPQRRRQRTAPPQRPSTRASLRNHRTPSPPPSDIEPQPQPQPQPKQESQAEAQPTTPISTKRRKTRSTIRIDDASDDSDGSDHLSGVDLTKTPPTRLNKSKNAARRAAFSKKETAPEGATLNAKRRRSSDNQTTLNHVSISTSNPTTRQQQSKQCKLSFSTPAPIVLHDNNTNHNVDDTQSQQPVNVDVIHIGEDDYRSARGVVKGDAKSETIVIGDEGKAKRSDKWIGSSKKRALHPFFSATKVTSVTSRNKVARTERPLCDAWTCPSATIHVNFTPLNTSTFSISDYLSWLASSKRTPPSQLRRTSTVAAVASLDIYRESSFATMRRHSIVRPLVVKLNDVPHFDLWTQRYRSDHRLDVINSAAIDELTDWLRPWYVKAASDDEDGDDILGELNDDSCDKDYRERLMLITGLIGCGKSNIIHTVASRLGLSVLEINSSTVRTGRRIKDILNEALCTHRIVTSEAPEAASTRKRPKTLIVFEEIDELHPDEKGFWGTLADIVVNFQHYGYKRPIICTANSFNAAMKAVFNYKSSSYIRKNKLNNVQHRLNQLLTGHLKEDLDDHSLSFKSIHFNQHRSERQVLSVLLRICKSERVHLPSPDDDNNNNNNNNNRQAAHRTHDDTDIPASLLDCIAALHRLDIRRAINELQFWAANGAHYSSGEREQVHTHLAMSMIEADGSVTDNDVLLPYALLSCSLRDASASLSADADALAALSDADVLLGRRAGEVARRLDETLLSPDALCLDADLQHVGHVASDIATYAVVSCLPHSSLSPPHVARAVQAVRLPYLAHGVDVDALVGRLVCRPRLPVLADYVPILVSMVRAAKNGGAGVDADAPRRRTRARTKRTGLSALNLDTATLSMLRQLSIAGDHIESSETVS